MGFDWNRARAFLVTAEEGSFSAAARALGMAQPTLGRQVVALEQELSVLLFDRVGRRLVLTEAGSDLLEHVRAMGDAASRLSLVASGKSSSLEGRVSISATEAFAIHLLPPMIRKIRETHPGLTLEISATNEVADLLRREADIAIRNVRPDREDLMARKVLEMQGSFYATTGYLDSIGRPADPHAFSRADFIGWGPNDELMYFLNGLGFSLTADNFPLQTESHPTSWAMVQAGLGIGVMAEYIAARTPGVEPILPDMQPIPFPVWLVTHRELHTSRRLRAVFDILAECFAEL